MSTINKIRYDNQDYDLLGYEEYSTDETIIGIYKGKPLYRKVVEFTNLTLNTGVAHNITNIDKIIKADIILDEGGYFKPLPVLYQDNGTINSRFCISLYGITSTQFHISAGSYYTEHSSTFKYTLIAEYTKTTDNE